MRNTHRCPKCQSQAIVEIENKQGQQLTPVRIGAFKVASTSRYICCDCGYMEEWINNPKDLKKLKKKL